MKQPHNIQMSLLRKLLFAPSLSFSQLQEKKTPSNQLAFHLQALVDAKHITKFDDWYSLTQSWKEYANRMDTETNNILPQAKRWVLVISYKDTWPEKEYLIYTRLKHPFFGKQWFITGKIEYGETVIDTAQRELFEEAWLTGTAILRKIEHYIVYDENNKEKILEDKFFYVCIIKNPTGNIIPNEEWDYYRVKESELDTKVTNHFYDRANFMKYIDALKNDSDALTFEEKRKYTSDF